jgi:pimeloyl-ACP methyl ester carboxylesterase
MGESPRADAFQGWLETYSQGKHAVPAVAKQAALRFRFLFVGGFSADHSSSAFAQNAKELHALGVSRKSIAFIYPDSNQSIEENADKVRDQIVSIAAQGPEKLVIIAHSRGACQVMAFALNEPQFVADRVEAMFLLQGPFGGSGLADYLSGEGPPVDRRMPGKFRLLARLIGKFETWRLSRGQHQGLRDLTRARSRRFWSEVLASHAESISIISPKVFYITAATSPSRLPLFQKAMAWYLRTYFGPSDGMVAPEDQFLPGVGKVIAVLEAGHSDLIGRFPSSKAKPKVRKAMIRSIVTAVAQP